MGCLCSRDPLWLAPEEIQTRPPWKDQPIPVRITRVVDGDTVIAMFMVGDSAQCLSLRLMGYDAPELKVPEQLGAAVVCTSILEKIVTRAQRDTTAVFRKWDVYGGRVDAVLTVQGRSVSEFMIRESLAHVYHGRGARPGWTPHELRCIETKDIDSAVHRFFLA